MIHNISKKSPLALVGNTKAGGLSVINHSDLTSLVNWYFIHHPHKSIQSTCTSLDPHYLPGNKMSHTPLTR